MLDDQQQEKLAKLFVIFVIIVFFQSFLLLFIEICSFKTESFHYKSDNYHQVAHFKGGLS